MASVRGVDGFHDQRTIGVLALLEVFCQGAIGWVLLHKGVMVAQSIPAVMTTGRRPGLRPWQRAAG